MLHLLDNPGEAVVDAAWLLRPPGGRLLIADFDTHRLDERREQYGHRRLGISEREIREWAKTAGLKIE